MASDRILVTRSSMPAFKEYCEEIAPLWESHWLTNMGMEHKKLEVALKERLGIDNLALFTNGHNALECILEAMALPPGGVGEDGAREAGADDEVIVLGHGCAPFDLLLGGVVEQTYSIEFCSRFCSQ